MGVVARSSTPARLVDRLAPESYSDTASQRPGLTGTPASSEGAAALRNAATLAASLLLTTSIGYVASILVARFLGAERFGRVAGAEARASLIMALLSFGFDTYTRIEVSRRPSHAQEFIPGVVAFRAVTGSLLSGLAAVVLAAFHQSTEAVLLFLLFSAAQFLVQTNALLSACLQSIGRVRRLPVINLAAKLLWIVVMIGGIRFGLGPVSVPVGWIVGEAFRAVVLARRTSTMFGVRPSLRNQQTGRVLRASIPFTAAVIVTVGAQLLDVNLLSFLTSESEVGLYRNAQNLAAIAFFVGTIIPWVLTPMASRAAERSREELVAVMRRGFELVLVLAIPGSVLLALNADTIVRLSGRQFLPSIPSLRILASVLIATYVIVMAISFLQVQGRSWEGVRIAMVGVALDGVLNVALVRVGSRRLGVGGAGTTAAVAMLVSEFVVAALVVRRLGAHAWDRRGVVAVAKTVLAAVPVVLADRFLAGQGYSWLRVVADVLLYGANLVLLDVVRLNDLRQQIGWGVEP